jgi:hypothetical protein
MPYDVDDHEAKILWKAVREQYDAEPTMPIYPSLPRSRETA